MRFFKSPLGLNLSDCTNMMIMSHYGISVVINVRLYDSQDELKTGARKKTCPDTSSDCELHNNRDRALSRAHTVRIWPRFGRLRQNLKILKDSYNPRLKSVVFDCWFDMFTDSRLMAVAIKFHLRRNSGTVRRFGAQSCSVTTPMMNVKLSPFFRTSYEQN